MAKGRKMNGRYSEWDEKFESDECATCTACVRTAFSKMMKERESINGSRS